VDFFINIIYLSMYLSLCFFVGARPTCYILGPILTHCHSVIIIQNVTAKAGSALYALTTHMVYKIRHSGE